jgi:hypothetical protein
MIASASVQFIADVGVSCKQQATAHDQVQVFSVQFTADLPVLYSADNAASLRRCVTLHC